MFRCGTFLRPCEQNFWAAKTVSQIFSLCSVGSRREFALRGSPRDNIKLARRLRESSVPCPDCYVSVSP